MAEQTQQQHLLFHLLSKLSPQPLMANATTQQSPQSVTDCTLVQTIVNTDSMQKSPSESNFSDLEVGESSLLQNGFSVNIDKELVSILKHQQNNASTLLLSVSFPPFPVGKYSDVSTMDSTFSQPTGGSSAQFLADRSVPLAEDDSLVCIELEQERDSLILASFSANLEDNMLVVAISPYLFMDTCMYLLALRVASLHLPTCIFVVFFIGFGDGPLGTLR
ncbi:hypothetical protein LguiB_009700 [Lonicera macranthoides]